MNGEGLLKVIDMLGQTIAKAEMQIAQLAAENDRLQALLKAADSQAPTTKETSHAD